MLVLSYYMDKNTEFMLKGNIENVMNFCIHSCSFKNLEKRKKYNKRKGMKREAASIMKKHESFGSKLKILLLMLIFYGFYMRFVL